jgi:TrmH family RNA methyltransferase
VHGKKSPLVSNQLDPRFRALLALQTPQGRRASASYLIEGIRHVASAFDAKAAIELLLVDGSVLSNRFGQKLVRRIEESGVPCIRLAPSLYSALTLAADPQGIGAVLRQSYLEAPQVAPERDSLWLAVESVDFPGNLGTILRTAEAAGIAGIFLLGAGADPWDPACVRATMGALFSLRLIRCTARQFRDWAKIHGVAVVGSSPRGLMSYKAFCCRWPAVLMIGSERQGLSEQMIDAADFVIRIPMRGHCDSINAAVAAGILLFELSSQRSEDRVNHHWVAGQR